MVSSIDDTLAVIVRRNMKDGMTMEQAVESYMLAMGRLTRDEG